MIIQNEREIILAFCEKKFLSEGFVKVTMDEIASELGISKKTIYKHFPSKGHLVSEIVYLILNRTYAHCKDVLNMKADVIRKFTELINVYIEQTRDISPRWLRELELYMPELWQEIDHFRSKLIDSYLTQLITQGIRKKFIKSYPPKLAVLTFTSLSRAIMDAEFLINNKQTLEETIRYTFDMVFGGLLTKKGLKAYTKDKNLISKRN